MLLIWNFVGAAGAAGGSGEVGMKEVVLWYV